MFTGIIEKLGFVRQIDGSRIVIATGFTDLVLGESIAVNGACLTVAELGASSDTRDNAAPGDVLFFVSTETFARTNLGKLQVGQRVNLERALESNRLAGGRLSGHIVQGHVDGMARLIAAQSQDQCHLIELELPPELSRYCVEKGSITLNGVSLTINRLEDQEQLSRVHITLIPHTWAHTNFSEYAVGDPINVEVDVLAKYVERLCQPYKQRSSI